MLAWVPRLLRLERSAYALAPLLPDQDLRRQLSQRLQRLTGERRQQIKQSPPVVFIAVKHVDWERAGLVDSWQGVARTVPYDWGEDFDQHAPDWQEVGKPAFNAALLERVEKAVQKQGVTHFFSYLSGRWLYPETVDRINALGVVTINFSFDDSHRFWGKKRGGIWTGIADIASRYDLNLTVQDPRDVIKYRISTARALYLPPGGNEQLFASIVQGRKRHYVSFVGRCYGVRKQYIEYLQHNGIDVYVRGAGWPEGGVSEQEMLRIFAESYIVLGFGFVGSSDKRTSVKGRDYEIPLTGTAYLTSYNETLARDFSGNEEILFYRSREELLKTLKYYRHRGQELLTIGRAAKARASREHTWGARWALLLETIDKALTESGGRRAGNQDT